MTEKNPPETPEMDPFALASFVLKAAGREPTLEKEEKEKKADDDAEKEGGEKLPSVQHKDTGDAAAGLLHLLVARPEDDSVEDEAGLGGVSTKEEEGDSPAQEWEKDKVESTTPNKGGRKGRPASPLLACCHQCKLNHRTVAHCRFQQNHTAENWCEPQPKKKPKVDHNSPTLTLPTKPKSSKRPAALGVSEETLPVISDGPVSVGGSDSGQRQSAKRAKNAMQEQVRAEENITSPSRKSPAHKPGEKFPCAHCGRVFVSHAAMSGHKRYCKVDAPLQVKSPVPKDILTDMSEFNCPNCDRIFPTHASMSGHKRYCKPGKPMVPGASPRGSGEVAALASAGGGGTVDTKTRNDGKQPKAIFAAG